MMPLATNGLFIVGILFVFFPSRMSHNILPFRLPSIITSLFLSIFRWNLEKRAMQSSSHNCPIDNNEPVAKLSKM